MEVKVFSELYVDEMERALTRTLNYDAYLLDEFPYEERFPKGKTGIEISDDFYLNSQGSDFENAVTLYEELKNLNETQASDERMWVYFSHVICWDYMRSRWPANKPEGDEKIISRIISRYFLRSKSLRGLTRNGIARLWWYAHLTYDKSNSNPYELTEVLMSKADLTVGITERGIGCNRNIRTALLLFLKDNPDVANNEDAWRKMFKTVNLLGGVKNLPLLEVNELQSVLRETKTASF